MTAGAETPVLSVVVTIVGGGEVLRNFLRAITTQDQPPPMEVIVPYDATIPETTAFAKEFPSVRFVDMGYVKTVRAEGTPAGEHELYDRRREAGLKASKGEILSLTEDRAPPRSDWARNVVQMHRELPHAVIGGAVECVSPAGDMLNWGIYIADCSRYAPPFESGPRQWITDVNVSYKRRAIESTRDMWEHGYNEASVHWALMDKGETLWLSDRMVVLYQSIYPNFGAALPVRFQWGRMFGEARAKAVSLPKRIAYTLIGPAIPFVLFARHGNVMRQKGKFGRFLRAAPATMVLLFAWMSGELAGLITKKS
jgi:hypothetical protein